MRIPSLLLSSLLSSLLCVVTAQPLLSQMVEASLRGRVADASGGVVARAEIELVDENSGVERTTRTGRAGAFAFPAAPAGSYTLRVRAEGFKTYEVTGLALRIGEPVRVDVPLEVGGISEEVTVAADAAEVVSADLTATVIPNRFVQSLPLDGRNFLELSLLAPGGAPAAAGSPGSERGRFAFQVNGQREDSNAFLYDGVYAVDPVLNSFTFTPPVDAVQEFRVETNADAGQGRNSGAQISVSLKRGGSQFHGTVYEFLRNDALDARNFFDPADRDQPKLTRNQFGFSLGGPVVRGRTFFFADYEGLRERRAVTRLTNVPTAAERAGDFSAGGRPPFDPYSQQPFPNGQLPAQFQHPVGQGIANLYPLPNRAAAGQNYVSTPTGEDGHNKFDVRLDQSVGDRGVLAGRFSFADRNLFQPFAARSFSQVPGYGNDVDERGMNAMVSETHQFGARWVNEARFGFNRVDSRTFHENSGTSINKQVGLPDFAGSRPRDLGLTFIEVTGFTPLGDEFNNPQDSLTDSFQISDNVSLTHGDHLVQFGFEQRWLNGSAYRDVQSRGQISFTNQAFSQNALADLLLGIPSFTAGGLGGEFGQNPRSWATNLFLQDAWRLDRTLTLTLGLRYEYNQPAYDAQDAAATFDPASFQTVQLGTQGIPRGGYRPDRNNFAPRIGLAWTPAGSRGTVVRAGYGLYYNTSSLAIGQGIYFNPPFFNFQLFLPSQQSIIQLHDPWPQGGAAPVPPSATTYDPNLRSSYTQQWNFSVQQDLGEGLILTAGYNAARGVNLIGARDINQPAPSAEPLNLRPLPTFADINQIESSFDSIYHSLQAALQCRFRGGLSGLFSYTWSRSIDNASNFFASSGDGNFPQDSRDISAERGRSSFDTPHRFVGSFVYDLPFGEGKRFGSGLTGAAKGLLSGWQVAGVVTLQSGQPYTVYLPSELDNSNTGRSIFGFGAGDRPHLVGDPNPANPDPTAWIDPRAFAMPAFGTFGNAGRNIVNGPDLRNINVSLLKDVSLGEQATLQFRAEFFNAWNRPNFGAPSVFFGTPGFGQIASAAPGRELQFGVKLLF